MKPILVLYSAREEQTCPIAEHIAEYLYGQGLAACVEDVETYAGPIDTKQYHAVVLAASVRLGSHGRAMLRFVKEHRLALNCLRTALLAVSLAAESAESHRLGGKHVIRGLEVEGATDAFLRRTGLRPASVLPVAGALLFTQDGTLVRFVLQQIAKDAPDVAREFESAAYAKLDRFVDDFLCLHAA